MLPSAARLSQLYLLRHGQTEWSLSGRHTGRTEIALTEAGERQARALAPLLRGVAFARVLTSPRRRAQQTCALAGLAPPPETEPDLAEWDYGEYEGLLTAEIRKQRPDWDIFAHGCPGGETPQQVSDRADRVLQRVAAMAGHVALFSHGHFGSVLGARWIGLPVLQAQHLWLDTASLSMLGRHPSRPETPILTRWNIVADLPAR